MIRILGIPFAVRGDLKYEEMDTSGNVTACDQAIRVAYNIGPQAQEAVLLHEILEVIDGRLELNLSHTQIKSIETSIYAVLIDNGVSLRPLVDRIDRVKEI
jgi:hypothetical protein